MGDRETFRLIEERKRQSRSRITHKKSNYHVDETLRVRKCRHVWGTISGAERQTR